MPDRKVEEVGSVMNGEGNNSGVIIGENGRDTKEQSLMVLVFISPIA